MVLFIVILFIVGYLIGSIPFGYLLGRFKKIDIRQFGSGNIGATNIFRKFGFLNGFLVGLLDFLKSYFFVFTIFSLNNIPLSIKMILSISPIIGHIFPIWLKFKGGKGVSCTFGLITAICGWKFFILWFIVWIVLLLITHLMSLINLLMSLTIPFIFELHFKTTTSIIFGICLTIIIWWTHRENIKKLLKGTENKIF